MNAAKPHGTTSVVAVYPDRDTVEQALQRLHDDGFDMRKVSIVARDFKDVKIPVGLVTEGDYVEKGAEIGAVVGGILGLCIGVGLLILPGLGFVVVGGPLAISPALLGGIEGTAVGAAVGGLAGALVGWGVPDEAAVKYETHVQGGKFLVIVRGDAATIDHARGVLASHRPEILDVYR